MSGRESDAPPTWVIFGAGGHARSLEDVLTRLGGRVVAVAGAPSRRPWPVPIFDSDDEALAMAALEGHRLALGTGDNAVRRKLLELITERNVAIDPVVASTATVARCADLGAATAIFEHGHVGPASRLGAAVIVNTGAVVEHDCVVGDWVHIGPSAVILGGVEVGSGALVGSGARLLPGVEVGDGAIIGAGSIVTRNVPAGATVVGAPARPIRS